MRRKRKKDKKVRQFVPAYLTPDQYLEHWLQRKVWTHLDKPRHQKRLRWCADQCVGATFADVGCMLGHSTAIMAARHPGLWTGVDFSLRAIEDARVRFPDIAFTFIEQPEMLNTAGLFDSVVCSEVIEHVEDDAAFLRLLHGITGQRLILTTPCVDAQDPGHVRIYTPETMATLLDGYRATVEKDESFFYITVEAGE